MPADENQSPEGSRRRIVIPLNRQPPGAYAGRVPDAKGSRNPRAPGSPRKSRVVKILSILGIFIVALVLFAAGGIFLWWQHYETTPAYSLALLVDAAQRNDMATMDTIIDTDQIVDNFGGQVKDQAANRYGIALGGVARKQIELLAPRLMPTIRQNLRDALATRVKELSENGGHKPFVVVAIGLPYFVNIAASGDTAKATATVHDQPVELSMQRSGNGWKVVAFKDDALVQRIIDQVVKDLPAIGQPNETRTTDIRKHPKKLPLVPQGIQLP